MTPAHKRIVLLLGAAGLLAAGLARCVTGERGGASTTPSSLPPAEGAPTAVEPALAPSGPGAPAGGRDAGVDGTAAEPASDSGSVAPGTVSTATAFMAATTPADRAYLADIERLAKRSPPPAAGELIKLQHAGASRAELERFIDQSFGTEVALRTPALRWLEQVMPTGKPTAPAVPTLDGTNPGRIKTPTRK